MGRMGGAGARGSARDGEERESRGSACDGEDKARENHPDKVAPDPHAG